MHPELTDRASIKELLFKVLRGVYRLEQYEVNKFGLTFQQIYLLKFLNRHPKLSISDIAREMHMKAFSATRLVDQLEGKKLIEREKSRKDRRSVFVNLNKKGHQLIKKIDDNTLDILLNNIGEFPQEDIKAFLLTSQHFEKILSVKNSDKNK